MIRNQYGSAYYGPGKAETGIVVPDEDLCALDPLDGAGSSFNCHKDDVNLHGLKGGSGFTTAWVDLLLNQSVVVEDSLNSYSDDTDINGLSGGTQWDGAWVNFTLFNGLVAEDNLNALADDVEINGLGGGTGWNGSFVDKTLTA